MHLELAENGTNEMYLDEGEMYLDEEGNLVEGEEELSPYVFVPGEGGAEGVYLREDYFDNLPDQEWERLMIFLESNQPGLSLFGLGKKARARRAERKDRRQERKLARLEAGGGIGGFLGKITGGLFGGGAGAGEEIVDQPKKRNYTPWIIGGVSLIGLAAILGARRRRRKRR